MTDPIRDELDRLAKEFRKLVDEPTNLNEETTPQDLTKYGLTLDEAKAWLINEPKFNTSDDFLHDKRNRRGLDRTR
jgi:hypothetical protein